jgi:hypothetical protein
MPAPGAEPTTNTLHRSVIIEAAFASDIQHDVAMRVLGELLEAWKANVESSHKRNIITIAHGREPITTS